MKGLYKCKSSTYKEASEFKAICLSFLLCTTDPIAIQITLLPYFVKVSKHGHQIGARDLPRISLS